MRSFKEIKHNYRFTEDDEKRLVALRPLMEAKADEVMATLSLWIMGTKGAAKYFTEESRQKHVFGAQREWFLDLFSGQYDNHYYEKLIRIGATHVRQNVDAHYMNRSINLVKNACIGIIQKMEEEKEALTDKIISLERSSTSASMSSRRPISKRRSGPTLRSIR